MTCVAGSIVERLSSSTGSKQAEKEEGQVWLEASKRGLHPAADRSKLRKKEDRCGWKHRREAFIKQWIEAG